jgi:hypothetical protein
VAVSKTSRSTSNSPFARPATPNLLRLTLRAQSRSLTSSAYTLF